MIPELGQFSLTLTLVITVMMGSLPLIGALTRHQWLQNTARPLATGQFVLLTIALLVLINAFVSDDFSVLYVANNSNTLLPLGYKISAVWGAHEGSLLLWVWLLALWTFAVALFSRQLPQDMVAIVLAVMGMISTGFMLFMILTSNPFERILPTFPPEGRDLNPLLQDFGLIVHPPMLYLGYVGFSVAFAFSIAALIHGKLDAAWARWMRPWTYVAWAFLTVGIALGSWWAYYELGWGGWWFWDPVENASFMPWLVGTGLVHSLAVTEKRGVFKSWTILLAILAFSLSLLGTFLVRSGVLTSVHSFATDPDRGLFILIFLGIVVGGSLTLYALRAPDVQSSVGSSWLSREVFLLLNNIVLVVALVMVLIGTLYPLVADAFNWGKISVGPPYFNRFFIPLMGLLMLLVGIGPLLQWKSTATALVQRLLTWPALVSLVAGGIGYAWLTTSGYGEGSGSEHWKAALALALATWVVATGGRDLLHRVRNASSFVQGLKRLTPSYYAMQLAHVGVAVTAVGISLTSLYSMERDLRMAPGDSIQLAGYDFRFDGSERYNGPNYTADKGTVVVLSEGQELHRMYPEKRRYLAMGSVMTEAGIDPGLFRDLYIAMGEPLADNAWALRVQVKPFVRWIWLGAIFMSLGAFLALWDKRYRSVKVANTARPEADVSVALKAN